MLPLFQIYGYPDNNQKCMTFFSDGDFQEGVWNSEESEWESFDGLSHWSHGVIRWEPI